MSALALRAHGMGQILGMVFNWQGACQRPVRGFVRAEPGTFAVSYHAHRVPIDPGSYPVLLKRAESRIADAAARASVSSLSAALGYLPARGTLEVPAMEDRARSKERGMSAQAHQLQMPLWRSLSLSRPWQATHAEPWFSSEIVDKNGL